MSTDKLSMSLDDIIKKSREEKRAGKKVRTGPPRGKIAFGTATRRASTGSRKIGDKKLTPKVNRRKSLNNSQRSDSTILESGPCKLVVSNLDFAVNSKDMKELFSEYGLVKSADVHYGRTGKSQGTADVIFARKCDAIQGLYFFQFLLLIKYLTAKGLHFTNQLLIGVLEAPV